MDDTRAPRLLDQVRQQIRLRHYSFRTEKAYVGWIRRFILFHGKRHPREMGAPEIEAFLSHLAVERHVSASTQNQAFNALLFLFKHVLELDFGKVEGVVRAKRRGSYVFGVFLYIFQWLSSFSKKMAKSL